MSSPYNKPRLSLGLELELVRRYAAGASCAELARDTRYNRTKDGVRRALIRHGVTLRAIGRPKPTRTSA